MGADSHRLCGVVGAGTDLHRLRGMLCGAQCCMVLFGVMWCCTLYRKCIVRNSVI